MPLISIGYGNRSIDEFVQLLSNYKTRFLVDVRSKPYARDPEFNGTQLEKTLSMSGIKYVFMGDLVGGRPNDPGAYAENGVVEYSKVRELLSFKVGIERLKRAASLEDVVVIMCSELHPSQCHRSKLIGEALAEQDVCVEHIDADGKLCSQKSVMQQVKGENPLQPSLFAEADLGVRLTSRKSYLLPNNRDKLTDLDRDDQYEVHEESYDD